MNNNKELMLFDRAVSTKEDSVNIQKTRIIFRDPETQEIVFEQTNKVIAAGSLFTAMKHYNINAPVSLPSYNTDLSLQNSVTEVAPDPGVRRDEQIILFCVGTDGCGAEQHQVYSVDFKKRIAPSALVPFRYPLATADLAAGLRTSYYGRKVVGDRVAYYFKKFETTPTIKAQYVDGTPIDANLYNSTKTDEVEIYVELLLKITKDDCREFFQATTGINNAKVNSLSLCTAWPKDFSGTIFYQDIRPATRLNFPSEPLIDLTKGLDITYQTFY